MDRNAGRSQETDEDVSEVDESKKGPGKGAAILIIDPIKIQRVTLTLIGETPLVMHHFAQKGKALGEMRDAMLGKPKPKKGNRPPKNPVQEFSDAFYCHGAPKVTGTIQGFLKGQKVTAKGDFYVPFAMLKGAIETAATDVDGASKAGVRRAVRIVEANVPVIHKGAPYMREDVVRIGQGKPDIRYRPQFDDWSLTFSVDVNSAVLTPERLVNLFNVAGFAAGLGEWRPEKGGEFGRFTVKSGRQ